MSEYKEEDIVLVGWPAASGPPEAGNSTQVNCHKCGQPVWVSQGSVNTVLDAKIKSGGELYIVCLKCAPLDDEDANEMKVGDEQKEEMLRAGFDFDKYVRESGMSIRELAKEAVRRAGILEEMKTLHHAANPKGCGNPRCRVCNPNPMEDGGAWGREER